MFFQKEFNRFDGCGGTETVRPLLLSTKSVVGRWVSNGLLEVVSLGRGSRCREITLYQKGFEWIHSTGNVCVSTFQRFKGGSSGDGIADSANLHAVRGDMVCSIR